MKELIRPDSPVKLAIIGAGARSSAVYQPLLKLLGDWIDIVAVCDPVREHAERYAVAIGAQPYFSIHDLLKDRPMEAAMVVTPVESHHSLSVTLSAHGVHHLTETSWASTVHQARDMVATAARHKVVTRVAENFFRTPIDRFSQVVRDICYLGRIGRIVSYADHTGYHNNSRWIVFAKAHPTAVQCVEHHLDHPPFYSTPQRRHETEPLEARFFFFPNDFLVLDVGSGHAKGLMGRHPRPGYTEWHGQRGTLMHQAGASGGWGEERTELRYISDAKLEAGQRASGSLLGGGTADVISPVRHLVKGACWLGNEADTPIGRIAYENPIRMNTCLKDVTAREWYGVGILDEIIDFVLAVRGLRESEFNEHDALASQMMEAGAQESALNEGKRVQLPLVGELASDARTLATLRDRYGVDPLDVEAMLALAYPKP